MARRRPGRPGPGPLEAGGVAGPPGPGVRRPLPPIAPPPGSLPPDSGKTDESSQLAGEEAEGGIRLESPTTEELRQMMLEGTLGDAVSLESEKSEVPQPQRLGEAAAPAPEAAAPAPRP